MTINPMRFRLQISAVSPHVIVVISITWP